MSGAMLNLMLIREKSTPKQLTKKHMRRNLKVIGVRALRISRILTRHLITSRPAQRTPSATRSQLIVREDRFIYDDLQRHKIVSKLLSYVQTEGDQFLAKCILGGPAFHQMPSLMLSGQTLGKQLVL
jgi:hypothetical protein